MVQMYTIMGRQIGSHWLAMATLSVMAVGAYIPMSGGGSAAAKKAQGPPINAQSPDEESFIKDFLKNAEADAKKGGDKAAH